MNFQHLFFDTYIGYFLQALPAALIVDTLYGVLRFRKNSTVPIRRKLFSCVFVCYITGLICLVLGLDIMGNLWYRLLYRMDPGSSITWFTGEFDFGLDFFYHINGEMIGNFLMFLPFGILHPLSKEAAAWRNTVLTGIIFVLAVEVLQPVFGRMFDLNDIILNTVSIIISASLFFTIRDL